MQINQQGLSVIIYSLLESQETIIFRVSGFHIFIIWRIFIGSLLIV